MSMKLDKRVIRTRKQLQGALLQLIEERPYEFITIKDIITAAKVSRATFYLHYRDKNELLMVIADDKLQLLVSQLSSDNLQSAINNSSLSVNLFETLAADSKLYKTLFHDKETGDFHTKIQQLFSDAIQQLVTDISSEDDLARISLAPDLLYAYLASGTIAMISWWFENDMPESAEYMADISRRMALFGTLPFLMGTEGPNI